MDQVTITKNNFRLAQWSKIIQECQASGQSITSWCEQHDIKVKTYYYWLRKIRLLSMEQTGITVPQQSTKMTAFQKLEVKSPVTHTQTAVIIHLPAATIEVQNGVDQQKVEAVILALKTVC